MNIGEKMRFIFWKKGEEENCKIITKEWTK